MDTRRMPRRIGALEGRLRRLVNPASTGLTRWWTGGGIRRVPGGPAPFPAATSGARPTAVALSSTMSPGPWTPPPGTRPGWNWLPEHGALPALRAMPRWVRVWYRTPFLDRYAHEWMWWHGGWCVLSPTPPNPPDEPGAGVREPRRPHPTDRSGVAEVSPPPHSP